VALYLLAGSSIQLLLPANAIVNSPAPFADAMVSRWGQGVAVVAALAISISAFGCLNGLILATGELGYSMALRGDLPAALARTRGANTPIVSQLVASGMTILLLLANTSRSTANLYTFIVLLSAAGCIVLYFISSLAAWKSSRTIRARSIIILALLFATFAAYGTGLEAGLWCLVLLAAGLAIRAVMRRLSSLAPSPVPEAAPAAPRE
jgi:APA family basic amino acid/polyamine antiporter